MRRARSSRPKIDFSVSLAWQIKIAQLPTPEREHKFHPTVGWKFDLAWPDRKIAIEIEGGIWRRGGGAHSHPTSILRDIRKYNEATFLGWRVFRVTTDEVKDGSALTLVIRALQ